VVLYGGVALLRHLAYELGADSTTATTLVLGAWWEDVKMW
jgi:hypothetical protein